MSAKSRRCPKCQAELFASTCWLCKHRLSEAELAQQSLVAEDDAPVSNPYQTPTPPVVVASHPVPIGETASGDYFTIILLVGLVIVFAGLVSISPGFGILLAIFTAPALIRTAVVISRKGGRGKRLSGGEKTLLFLASIAAVIAAGAAAAAAFTITCVASCFGIIAMESLNQGRGSEDQYIMPLFILAVGIGILVGGSVLYLLWRSRDVNAA